MQLSLENIGRLKETTIKVNGFTVLTGRNASGKSTILKTLYSLVEAPYSFDQKMNTMINSYTRTYYRLKQYDVKTFNKNKDQIKDPSAILDEMINDTSESIKRRYDKEMLIKMKEYLDKGENVHYFMNLFLNDILESEFKGQFYKVNSKKSSVTLSDDDHTYAKIVRSERSINMEVIESFNSVSYIDTPTVIENLFPDYWLEESDHRSKLQKKLGSRRGETLPLSPEKIGGFLDIISKAFSGTFRMTGAGLVYDSKEASGILAYNMAAGMKILAMIRLLVSNGSLTRGSLLLIDEPEIHLHPEWQLVLAEALIYLKKELGITIVMATHSAQFLMSVSKYSEITQTHVDYYDASINNGEHTFIEINDRLENVYRPMTEAMEKVA